MPILNTTNNTRHISRWRGKYLANFPVTRAHVTPVTWSNVSSKMLSWPVQLGLAVTGQM